ncbi:MAG TPA: pectin acetylesterase-family hydrolase [Kofleriaceae bacterium]|nr:pectin acetylesterase-family hydrolase [Kofleriaceae bacterium]
MKQMVCLVVLLGAAACGGDSGLGGGPPTLGTTPKEWEYVAIPGAQCMNGTPTGIGVNLGTSGEVVMYMEGGGACFNDGTCGNVAHPSGWGPDQFGFNIGPYNVGIFDRLDDKNPFRDATFVFVPYCTGDVHAGSKPDGIDGRKFVGYANVGLYLDYLVPKSQDVRRVILAGSSAGGFGALMNFDRTQTAWGDTPVYLLDDSGPPLADMFLSPCLQQMFRDAWNLDAALPASCTACRQADGGGLLNALGYLADAHPDSRMAIVTSTRDGVIRSFYGYGYPDCVQGAQGLPMPEDVYASGIADLRDRAVASTSNFRVYSKDSGQHVWLLFGVDTVSPRSDGTGEHLSQWLHDMLDPDSDWKSVAP